MGRYWLCLGALCALCISAGCGSAQPTAASAAPGAREQVSSPLGQPQPNLPAPATLRLASYTEASLDNAGSAFATASFPKNNVAVAGNDALFSPNWTAGQANAVSGLAYACYVFDASAYDRDFTIRFTWTTQQAAADFYVAVANFVTNRWVFYPGPANGILTLSAQQFNDSIETGTGRMAVAVILQGTAPWQLADMRLGALTAPTITGVNPLGGTEATQVTFGATATGGPIASIAWDFGNGANPNTSTALAPTVTLATAGIYQASVTATNAAGQNTFNFTLTVTPPAQQPPQIVGAGPLTGVTGSVQTFSASNVGGPVTTWSWDFGNGANPNTSTLDQPVVTLGAVGQYTVTVNASNAAGSSPPFTFSLDVTGAPPPPVIQLVEFSSGGLTGAPGQDVTLQATILGGQAPYTYNWQFGTAALPPTSTQDTPAEKLSATPGTYPCTLTVTDSASQQSAPFPFDIVVTNGGGNPPNITDVQPVAGVHDTSVQFTATNMGGPVTSWQWTFFPGMGTVDDATLPQPTMLLGNPTPPVPCSVDATNADGTSHFDFNFTVQPF